MRNLTNVPIARQIRRRRSGNIVVASWDLQWMKMSGTPGKKATEKLVDKTVGVQSLGVESEKTHGKPRCVLWCQELLNWLGGKNA